MAKHKHYDCIVAWAEGKQIEALRPNGQWVDVNNPYWGEEYDYRVKPEPKADQVIYGCVQLNGQTVKLMNHFLPRKCYIDNLSLTFDGETGKLKSAEVINQD
jgi:hypothetical protein